MSPPPFFFKIKALHLQHFAELAKKKKTPADYSAIDFSFYHVIINIKSALDCPLLATTTLSFHLYLTMF